MLRSTTQANFIVERGQLTFDAEGMEQGKYHSRIPHVPTNSSGCQPQVKMSAFLPSRNVRSPILS